MSWASTYPSRSPRGTGWNRRPSAGPKEAQVVTAATGPQPPPQDATFFASPAFPDPPPAQAVTAAARDRGRRASATNGPSGRDLLRLPGLSRPAAGSGRDRGRRASATNRPSGRALTALFCLFSSVLNAFRARPHRRRTRGRPAPGTWPFTAPTPCGSLGPNTHTRSPSAAERTANEFCATPGPKGRGAHLKPPNQIRPPLRRLPVLRHKKTRISVSKSLTPSAGRRLRGVPEHCGRLDRFFQPVRSSLGRVPRCVSRQKEDCGRVDRFSDPAAVAMALPAKTAGTSTSRNTRARSRRRVRYFGPGSSSPALTTAPRRSTKPRLFSAWNSTAVLTSGSGSAYPLLEDFPEGPRGQDALGP